MEMIALANFDIIEIETQTEVKGSHVLLEKLIQFFDLARWYLESSGVAVGVQAYANSRDPQRLTLFETILRHAQTREWQFCGLFHRHSQP